jgi:hypothetical protein
MVSPQGLRVDIRAPLSERRVDIPAEELETVALGRSATLQPWAATNRPVFVLAASDRTVVAFGSTLSDEARRWLCSAILYGLVADVVGARR